MSFSWSDKYPLLDTILLKVIHHHYLRLPLAYSHYYNRPSRPFTYFHPVNLLIFEDSSMSNYERPWPAWSRQEEVLFIYLHSREFELSDVAQIVEYKLHRRARSREAFFKQMVRINQGQALRSLPTLCDDGMTEWNRAAVDSFLIRSTDDADSLQSLLWFHKQYIPLLRTVRPAIAILAIHLLMAA